MKKTIFLLFLVFFFTKNFSQNNLVIYTEQGEGFTVILNGIRQNSLPETNVKITGLIQPSYKLKIIFSDKALSDVDQTVYLMEGGNPVQGVEFSYSVVKKDEKYKVKLKSYAAINQLPPPPPEQAIIVYSTTPAPLITTTTTTTTTTGYNGNADDNVSLGVNVNGIGLNMNVNINDGMDINNSTTYTETTHTTTSTAINSTGTMPVTYVVPGYNGHLGCSHPMPQSEFTQAKQSISSKSFEDSKLTIAKQVISANCLASSQIKEIMLLFSFEDTRLDLAKYAYSYTYDIGNYYKLNDAFTFESSIDELNSYTQKYKQ